AGRRTARVEGELLQVHQRDAQRHRGRHRQLGPDLARGAQRHRLRRRVRAGARVRAHHARGRPDLGGVAAGVAVARRGAGHRPAGARGVELTPLDKTRAGNAISYRHVSAVLDRARGCAEITVRGPDAAPPAGLAAVDARCWPLAMTRELDDLILDLRTNETEL